VSETLGATPQGVARRHNLTTGPDERRDGP
jgi:hypothetical protein